jgi:hypothetical protein
MLIGILSVSWIILVNVFPGIFLYGLKILGLGFRMLSFNNVVEIWILQWWIDMIFTVIGTDRTFLLKLLDLIVLEFDDVCRVFFRLRLRLKECCDVI